MCGPCRTTFPGNGFNFKGSYRTPNPLRDTLKVKEHNERVSAMSLQDIVSTPMKTERPVVSTSDLADQLDAILERSSATEMTWTVLAAMVVFPKLVKVVCSETPRGSKHLSFFDAPPMGL